MTWDEVVVVIAAVGVGVGSGLWWLLRRRPCVVCRDDFTRWEREVSPVRQANPAVWARTKRNVESVRNLEDGTE